MSSLVMPVMTSRLLRNTSSSVVVCACSCPLASNMILAIYTACLTLVMDLYFVIFIRMTP